MVLKFYKKIKHKQISNIHVLISYEYSYLIFSSCNTRAYLLYYKREVILWFVFFLFTFYKVSPALCEPYICDLN